MNKFKVGDKVRRIQDVSGDLPVGTVCEVTLATNWGSIEVTVNGMHRDGRFESRNFELVDDKESELERLVRVANEGLDAVSTLLRNHRHALEYGDYAYQDAYSLDGRYIVSARKVKIKTKPTFEPFTVGNGWKVKLEGDMLYIGCKKFDAKKFADRFAGGEDNEIPSLYNDGVGYVDSGRKGITFAFDKEKHVLPYADLDKILESLNKAGVK